MLFFLHHLLLSILKKLLFKYLIYFVTIENKELLHRKQFCLGFWYEVLRLNIFLLHLFFLEILHDILLLAMQVAICKKGVTSGIIYIQYAFVAKTKITIKKKKKSISQTIYNARLLDISQKIVIPFSRTFLYNMHFEYDFILHIFFLNLLHEEWQTFFF